MAEPSRGDSRAPLPPSGALPRDRLLARLDEGLARGARLLLVLAPAGFGKSSLLAAWSRKCGRRVAWLSLGEGEARPEALAARLEAALAAATFGKVVGGQDAGGEAERGAEAASPGETLLSAAERAAEAARPAGGLVLVLDDWQFAEGEANSGLLSRLVEEGPRDLVLALGSRAAPGLPLARLRARGLLAELGGEDLRFDRAEARAFLAGTIGLELPDRAADALGDRVEGWAAGLRLAGLVLRGAADPESALGAFSAGHPFVFDYLAEEVLSREPPGRRAALLALSAPPRLCARLAEAVAGGLLDRPAEDFLEALARSGLFLAPLEGAEGWYRFHQLFADFLRRVAARESPRLPPEAKPESARRAAATWLFAAGEVDEALALAFSFTGGPAREASAGAGAETTPLAATQTAPLAAPEAIAFAAGLLEEAWPRLDARLRSGTSLAYARFLPDAELARRPSLAIGLGWALMNEGRVEEADRRLAATEAPLRAGPDSPEARAMLGRVALGRSYCALPLGRPGEAKRLAEEALALLPPGELQDRGGALSLLGAVDWAEGRLESAYRAFEEGTRLMGEAGNPQLVLASLAALADLRLAQGRPRTALALEDRARELLAASGGALLPYAADLFLALGEARLELGDLAGTRAELARSDEAARPGLLVDRPSRRALLASALAEAEGRPEEAARLLDEAEALAVPTPTPRAEPFAALRAELALARGDLGAALAWAASLDPRPVQGGPFAYLRDRECLAFALVAIGTGGAPGAAARPGSGPGLWGRTGGPAAAAADDALGEAIALLESLAADCAAGGRGKARLRALVLLSRALGRAGRGDEAARVLAEARAAAAPEGSLLPFLLFGGRGDGTARGSAPAAAREPALPREPDAGAPLSPREAEVLALVAEGLANKEIAARLGLSLSTVKGYVQALFEKLPAVSRTQAVARARERGLLP